MHCEQVGGPGAPIGASGCAGNESWARWPLDTGALRAAGAEVICR